MPSAFCIYWGDDRLPVRAAGGEETVECLATAHPRGLAVLVYNHQLPRAPIRPEKVRLRLAGRPPGPRARLWRIDDECGNPKHF